MQGDFLIFKGKSPQKRTPDFMGFLLTLFLVSVAGFSGVALLITVLQRLTAIVATALNLATDIPP
jgi:hypothetical protein